jgi:hypothetical protein
VKIVVDDKKVLLASYLTLLNGILHATVGVLAIGLLELSLTAFIFSAFFIFLGLKMISLMRNHQLDETKRAIIACTTISFLNSITMFTHILIGSPEDRVYLLGFMIFFTIVDLINFLIFYLKKIELDQMDKGDKISYFAICIIRGIGLGLLFNILAWIGWPPDPNPMMIIYNLIFGTLCLIFGERLYDKKEEKKIQMRALIVLVLGLIIGIVICVIFPFPNTLVNIILYSIVIPIRIYYIRNKF